MGGLLVAAGAVALEIRKAASWGVGGRMLVVLVPAVVLYALALDVLGERRHGPRSDAEPWQSVLAIVAVILNSIWLTLFFRWVGVRGSPVTVAGFVLTAASAGYAAWRANVRFAALLAGLDLVVAWLALWNKILGQPSANTNRWLLMIVGVILVAGAVGLARRARREASEFVTAAGVAGVVASSIGVYLGFFALTLNRVLRDIGLRPLFSGLDARQHFIWDLVLLLISVGLITYGARARVRGPGYVGTAGLLIFVFSVGYQFTARRSPNSVAGWPVALLLIGAGALVLGFFASRFARARGAPSRPSPPQSTAPPPAP
jgi:uncharacterized membrane-anchored protein